LTVSATNLRTDVSIVVPLYNKGPYINETIQSVRQQTHTNWQLLVINNGSTDEGPKVVDAIAADDSRVCLWESPRKGPGTARNFGVEHADRTWILFLDADDLIESTHLESLVREAAANPDASVIAGGWQEFVDGQPTVRNLKRPNRGRQKLLNGSIAASPWAVHAAIVKRELVHQIRWPEDMDGMLAEDNAFWFSICLAGIVAYSESNGALYRTQTSNCRTQSHDIEKWFTGVHEAVQRNLIALKQRNLEPNAEQCATLMRLYSKLYSQALIGEDPEFSKRALAEARRWFDASKDAGHRYTTTMLLRQLIGIDMFERTRRLFGR
jgi:glycosyltransferase involved in cell wall biosynthesis